MKINNAIVHYIKKERHSDPEVKPKEELLKKDKMLNELISALTKLYNTKTSRGYGVFNQDTQNYILQKKLHGYIYSGVDFLTLSKDAINILLKNIRRARLATGGYILFADYEVNSKRYILIASIKQRPGLAFDEKLNLKDSTHIDLENLHEMARIDVNGWAKHKELESRYISFAKHRGGRDEFSEYFKEFIGCQEIANPTTLTKLTIAALIDYCKNKKLDPEQIKKIKSTAFNYFDEKEKSGDPVSLKLLSHRIDEENPDSFLTFINSDDKYQISDGFDPIKSAFKTLKTFNIKEGSIKVQFDFDDIGKKISINPEKNEIVISKIDTKYIDELKDLIS